MRKKLFLFICIVILIISLYFILPINKITIKTNIATASEVSSNLNDDKIYLLYHKNVLYFDEFYKNKKYESFVSLGETRFKVTITEDDVENGVVIRHYRGLGIAAVDKDKLIKEYDSKLKEIKIVIPRGKLEFKKMLKDSD